jgi:DegV family protein with EDD domain
VTLLAGVSPVYNWDCSDNRVHRNELGQEQRKHQKQETRRRFLSQVRIVTDSTAQLNPELAQELGVTVVPMHISFGTQKFREGVDLTTEEFFRRVVHSPVLPTSSAPSVEEFRQVYAALSLSTDKILSLNVSSKLNKTCLNAHGAAEFFLGRCEIEVIDSWTISLGLRILVEATARAAAKGATLDEIVRLARGMIPHVYAVFFTDTLEYLERDHHLTESQAMLGKMLSIRPFLALEEGEIVPMEKVRTREKAVDKLIEFVAEFSRVEQIAVVQSPSRSGKDARFLLDRLQSNFPDYVFDTITYGPTLGTHIGPVGLGLIVYEGMA